MVKVPLTSDPCQELTITLGGVSYVLVVKWCELRSTWTMDILRASDSSILASGVSLVVGVNVLQGFGLDIGEVFIVDTGSQDVDATADDLGDRVLMFYNEPGET